MKKGIYINDSIHGLISLSEYEKRIISSVGFNRLHDVYQNSTVYLTFPTNRTKRFEHSIGTMKICSDMFFYSVLNADEDTLNQFYTIFTKEYIKIINDISANFSLCEHQLGGKTPKVLPDIGFDKSRNSLCPYNVPSEHKVVHLLLIQSIRIAALLHDIGHPPFSHIVEDALKSVYDKNADNVASSTEQTKLFINIMSKYFKQNKKLHEQMGDEISDIILKGIISNTTEYDNKSKINENLFEILVLESVKKIFAEAEPFSYLHRIIDSSLDGDRLDYVTRTL